MDFDRHEVSRLYYSENLSAREIGEKYRKTTWQIISFMRKNHLIMRSPAETRRFQFLRSPLSFSEHEKLSNKKKRLWIAGLSLYWAEGVKFENNHVVDLANSDEGIVLIFLKMMREIYRVDEKRLRILLYSYENQNQTKLIKYWSDKLKISSSQFTKPYVRKDYKEGKRNKMPHGLIHIRYNDLRLFRRMMTDIDIIRSELLG